MCDDVFDDGHEGASRAELDLMSKEFEKMNTKIEQIGFRDGFLKGKDESSRRDLMTDSMNPLPTFTPSVVSKDDFGDAHV